MQATQQKQFQKEKEIEPFIQIYDCEVAKINSQDK